MLSSTFAGSCKQSRRCHCKFDKAWIITTFWLKQLKASPHSRYYVTATNRLYINRNITIKTRKSTSQLTYRNWIHTSPRSLSSTKPHDDYNAILTGALDQSNGPITQSLVEQAFNLLRKGNPELAWECYKDITSGHRQKFISREQYKQLIKFFNHSKVKREQTLEYILTLVEDMKQLGYQVGRKEKLLVMRLLGLNGNLKAMESVFQDLSKEELLIVADPIATQKPFNILLTAYNEHRRTLTPEIAAEKSMKVYGEMLDYNLQPNSAANRLLMENIRVTSKSNETVEKVWEWLWAKIGMNVGGKTVELDPSIYSDMVFYFSSAGRAEYALEINDIMTKKNISRSLRLMNALIHKVGRSGNIDKAMELFVQLLETHKPSLVTLNAVIDIYAHKKPSPDVDGANQIFKMLTEANLKPDVITFGTMIDMYAKKGDLLQLKKFFYDMTKTHKITPNPHIFSSVIECFMKCGDRESAMEILRILQKAADRQAKPAREAYNLMFKGLVKSGHIRDALELLETMSKGKSFLDSRTFTPLLEYFAKQGNTVGAHQVASLMAKLNIKPSNITYTLLLESHSKAGDIEGAEEIYRIIKDGYTASTYVYNAMLYLYTEKNEMDKVLEIYRRMSKTHALLDEYTYGILMNYYAKRQEPSAVVALLKTMQSHNIKPSIAGYTMMMQTYFESGRPEEARNMLKRIIEEGLQPTDITMSIFVQGCIDNNELHHAETVVDEAIEEAKSKPKPVDNNLLKDNAIVDEKSYEKYLPETIEDVLARSRQSMQPQTLSPYIFTPLLNAYVNSGAFDKAKTLLRTMNELRVPISLPTFTSIMNMYRKQEQFDTVEALWQGIYKGQETVETLDPEVPTLAVPERTERVIDLLSFESLQFATDQVSNFALSIYMDSLTDQKRYQDLQQVWHDLGEQKYEFDEQNINRYVSSLIQDDQLTAACKIVMEQLFDNAPVSNRKRNNVLITNDNPLHTRTCLLFAQVFDIPGYSSMGKHRLRTIVTDRIGEHLKLYS